MGSLKGLGIPRMRFVKIARLVIDPQTVIVSKIILNAMEYVLNAQKEALDGFLKIHLRRSYIGHSGVQTGHTSMIRHGSLFIASTYYLCATGKNLL